ncbi:hypothetical protein CYMTET_20469 [Cymbomonas tetramitiformis]|uniref:Cyclic nucleotide-binding domain-containing protein n=1 Tax=Cymbomonas tetramitiformis TaxID=36881 RepID=A0AAE0L467_9CHLO|nr:hypothetical protein CYMTET_20469 [Cymbomonas tetramitiformis]
MKQKWLGHAIVHTLLAVCAAYYSWTVPVYITFTPHRCGECNATEKFVGNLCFDLFAWLLLWFWFRYIRAGMEKAGASFDKSFLRYHSVFVLSVIGLLPIDYFGYLASPSTAYYLRAIRLLLNAHPHYFRELYANAMVLSSRMNVAFNLGYVMGMFFWLNHLVACVWWGVSRLQNFPSDDGEYWGPDEELQNSRLRTQYLSALVWAVKATTSATTTREFDDVQRLVTIIVVVAGIIVVSIIIAEICSIFMGANAVIAEYRQIMDVAEASLSHSKCSEELRKKIHEYYRLAWQTRLAISSGGEFDSLPPFVQKEVNCAQKAELMSQVPLFRKNDNVMNSVAEKLGSLIAIKGDFIYREGELGSSMYFISLGIP